MRLSSPEDLELYREQLLRRVKPQRWVRVCAGTGCLAGGSQGVYEALVERSEEHTSELQSH